MRHWTTCIALIAVCVQNACSSDEQGGAASHKCGDLAADAGDAGNFFFDTTSRLAAPTEPVRAPPLVADIELRGAADFQGTVDPSDPLFKRVGNLGCIRPPPGYDYYGETYTIRLVGPGPHNLIADTCGSPQGDSMLYLYQDSEGSSHPLDLDDPCPHLVAYDDDACGPISGRARIRASGLKPGVVQLLVTTFGTTATSMYQLKLLSDTSCP